MEHIEDYMDRDDVEQFAVQQEAYYWFVITEFAELSKQVGVHKVATDLNAIRHSYQYHRRTK